MYKNEAAFYKCISFTRVVSYDYIFHPIPGKYGPSHVLYGPVEPLIDRYIGSLDSFFANYRLLFLLGGGGG